MKVYIDNTEILDIDTTAQKLLENDLLDISEWVKNAILGKVGNCWGRFHAHWMPILMADSNVTSMPANAADFVAMVIARSDYKNRAERDAEAVAQEQQEAETPQL